jgi:hypothetical protein
VRKELDLAEEGKIIIVPLEIRPTIIPPSVKYQLVGFQSINLQNFEHGISLLTAMLEKLGNKSIGEKVIQTTFANFYLYDKGCANLNGVIYVTTHRLIFASVPGWEGPLGPLPILTEASRLFMLLSGHTALTQTIEVLSLDLGNISNLHERRIMFFPAIEFYAGGHRFVFTFLNGAKKVIEALGRVCRSV